MAQRVPRSMSNAFLLIQMTWWSCCIIFYLSIPFWLCPIMIYCLNLNFHAWLFVKPKIYFICSTPPATLDPTIRISKLPDEWKWVVRGPFTWFISTGSYVWILLTITITASTTTLIDRILNFNSKNISQT